MKYKLLSHFSFFFIISFLLFPMAYIFSACSTKPPPKKNPADASVNDDESVIVVIDNNIDDLIHDDTAKMNNDNSTITENDTSLNNIDDSDISVQEDSEDTSIISNDDDRMIQPPSKPGLLIGGWPKYKANNANTNTALSDATANSGTEKWNFDADGNIYGMVISETGNIYFGTVNGTFYMFDKNGVNEKKVSLCSRIDTSPVIGNKHHIYVFCNSSLIDLDEQGNKQWETSLLLKAGNYLSSPSIDNEGNIHVAGVKISYTGKILWNLNLESYEAVSPAIGFQDLVYYINRAYDKEGKPKWHYSTTGSAEWETVLDDKDNAYFLTFIAGTSKLHKMNIYGQHTWQTDPEKTENEWFASGFSLSPDKNFYLPRMSNNTYMIIDQSGLMHSASDPEKILAGDFPPIFDNKGNTFTYTRTMLKAYASDHIFEWEYKGTHISTVAIGPSGEIIIADGKKLIRLE